MNNKQLDMVLGYLNEGEIPDDFKKFMEDKIRENIKKGEIYSVDDIEDWDKASNNEEEKSNK